MLEFAKIINFRGKNFVTATKFREAPPICSLHLRSYHARTLTPVPTLYLEHDCRLPLLKQLAMASISFEVRSSIRGYHIYKTVWTPYIGETLPCCQENTNGHDPFAVKVLQLSGEDETIVGHLPRKISSVRVRRTRP